MSGRSAARLAHLLWEQRVVSSNPTAPTKHPRKILPAESSKVGHP